MEVALVSKRLGSFFEMLNVKYRSRAFGAFPENYTILIANWR